MAERPGQRAEPQQTRLESDEEIRQALAAHRGKTISPAQPPVGAPAGVGSAELEVQADRPVQRPPMALLCIIDDGKPDGEWIRLRADRTVIGRTDGDVRVPHDGLISGRHAEIVRQPTTNGYRWTLQDLGSTNGTFVRVGGTVLRPGNELLIGYGRYSFEGGNAPALPVEDEGTGQTTRAWAASPVRSLVPSLVEISPAGPVQRFTLSLPEYWIGRDSKACGIARAADVLVSPRHARLYRDAKGNWHVENNKSPNGVWLRVEEIHINKACEFRLGEQKFLFRVIA
jgi:pSer/pThr/pTyr-binding forkhead associated (FHA) protein